MTRITLITGLLLLCMVSISQTIITVAGIGVGCSFGDGGSASSAAIICQNIAFDSLGNYYLSDAYDNIVRKVDLQGNINRVAGNNVSGYGGDGGQAINASLNDCWGIALDKYNRLYIADIYNYRVRIVDNNGIINTFAGNGNSADSGDGGPALGAGFKRPSFISVDHVGNVYVAEDAVIRKIDNAGVISTIAGTGVIGYSGDGGPATSAKLNYPGGMDIDGAGNIYFAEWGSGTIRKIDASGVISTVVGTGTNGYNGDGISANLAQLNKPYGLSIASNGDLYICDYYNDRIRKVDAGSGLISTFAGDGTNGYGGDGGPANLAQLNNPTGLDFGLDGNLYIVDQGNHRVRMVTMPNNVEKTPEPSDVSIYPVPSTGVIHFSSSPGVILWEVQIRDNLGQLIQTKKTFPDETKLTIDTPGMYLITFLTNRGAETKKVIVR